MEGASVGLVTSHSELQFLLRMWLNVSLRGVRPFFMRFADNTSTPFKLLFEPGWRRNKASAEYAVAVSLDAVYYAPAPAFAGAGFAFVACAAKCF